MARGFLTSLAADGQQALRLIQSNEIHLALLDYHMPRLTGLEVIQQIRASGSQVPCILISGGLTDEIVQSAERELVVTVMQKPISVREVALTVHATVKQHYQWAGDN